VVGELPGRPQHDDLARARVAADPDLRIQARGPAPGVRDEHDDAARVLTTRVVRRLDRFLRVAAIGIDDEGEDSSESDGAPFLADPDERAVDLAGGRPGQLNDHR